jgi:hypothetical protein
MDYGLSGFSRWAYTKDQNNRDDEWIRDISTVNDHTRKLCPRSSYETEIYDSQAWV